ncbi:PQQ-dependent sugar dehydrogenase [Sphingomonas sp. 1P06PA]|uniref:PQQ-dependent sugar dehydrogenase n=1 Tax=Sphingomonas sp. 1P06PA TaxID=554121 RepID=UPI0039A76691
MARTINADQVFAQTAIATLPTPWSIAFLPTGQLLASESPTPSTSLLPTGTGNIRLVTTEGVVSAAIAGLPENYGVLDIELDPNFATNHVIYFSFLERDPNAPRIGRNAADLRVDPAGIAVARAVLDLTDAAAPVLSSSDVIWRQTKVVSFTATGEPGGRIAFSPDGHLFITAGDRQEFEPVQDLGNTLGKIIRINPDGSIPADNPYVGVEGAKPEIWSLGHRNPYGLVFGDDGVLWENEMGPRGGDELNVVVRGENYGWPNVSYGDHYDGGAIPKPAPGDGFEGSAYWWTPVIAPSGMNFYDGDAFSDWDGDLIISGLQSRGLVIVDVDGTSASEVGRISLGARTRDVVQGPDGSLWVIYDQPDGRLVRLSPLQVADTRIPGDLTGQGGADIIWRNVDGTVTAWTANGAGFTDAPVFARQVEAGWTFAATGDFNGNGKADILWRRDDGTVTTWLSSGRGFDDNDGAIFRKVGADWNIAGTGDFNGDGRTDILWRNINGSITDWLSTGVGFADNGAAGRSAPLSLHVSGVGDFNGDGKDDILWRGDDGAVKAWLSNGTGFADAASFTDAMGPAWHVAGTADFNGDGRDDILWRNDDGTVKTWLSAGGSFVSTGGFSAAVDIGWRVVGTGDYNTDGRADILWRNAAGTVTSWLSDGLGFIDNPAFSRTVDASWAVAQPTVSSQRSLFAAADFNGDGKDDLLWRNADGTVTDWLSENGGFADNPLVSRGIFAAWTIAGTGDFNGDGRHDILWRHADGTLTDWLSNGAAFSDNAAATRVVPIEWRVQGIGDFNGDGRDDILWRHADGTVTDWFSNGAGFTDNPALSRVIDAGWNVAGVGDFNGDGKDDILWRSNEGTVTNWLADGTGFTDNAALARTVSADWHIAGIGDFNGDGRDDILWRNDDGTVTDWLSTGTGFADNSAFARVVSTDWQIAGTGDYDGDGRDDILWRNDNGTLIDWLSNGTSFVDNLASREAVTLDWTVQHETVFGLV